MSENPGVWALLIQKLSTPEAAGVGIAMFISVIRVMYDRQETKPLRVCLEALICGALSLTATSAVTAMHLDVNWSIFLGGVIGYFGSSSVRAIALRIIAFKTGTPYTKDNKSE